MSINTKSKIGSSRFIEQEDTFVDDDDLGEYSDVEKLVQDPEREEQARNYINSRSHSQHVEADWQTRAMDYFYIILKPFMFVLFMVYWILKEPIIRTITFLTIVVSNVIVDPLLYLWSILPNTNRSPASVEKKKRFTEWCTGILVALFCILVVRQNYAYLNDYYHYVTSSSTPATYSSYELSKISKQLNLLEKTLKEHSKIISTLKTDTATHGDIIKQTQEQIMAQKQHYQEIKKGMDDQQKQLNTHRHSVNEEIKRILSDHESELFHAFLSSPELMDEFLRIHKPSIEAYVSNQINAFFEKHEKQGALMSKDTFMKLITGDNESNISLKDLVDSVLYQYHQDILNTPDFALASRGGRIIHSKTSPTYEDPIWYGQLRKAIGLTVQSHPPDMILLPQTHAGECWRMKGTNGHVRILLSEPIQVQGVTIEHPSANILLNDIQSAPRIMEFYGIRDLQNDSLNYLGRIEYNAFDKRSSVQTFKLIDSSDVFRAVLVKVKSNWGNNVHTDIYRIRIHGVPSH